MAFLLSGLIFPVETIPKFLQPLSNISPIHYSIVIVRDALIRGGGWPAVWWAVLRHRSHCRHILYLLTWKKIRADAVG